MACTDVDLLSDDEEPPPATIAQAAHVATLPAPATQPGGASVDILSDDDEGPVSITAPVLNAPAPGGGGAGGPGGGAAEAARAGPAAASAGDDSDEDFSLTSLVVLEGSPNATIVEEVADASSMVSTTPSSKPGPAPEPAARGKPATCSTPAAAPASAPPPGGAAPAPGQSSKPGSKADAKERKLSKEDMEGKVQGYMLQQNRPYNAQNVFDNLHGVVPKGQVQALLDSLALAGKLLVKEYGKSKVYLHAQSGPAASDEAAAQALEADLKATGASLQGARSRVEEARQSVSAVRNKRAAASEVAAMAQEAAELEQRLAQLRAAAEKGGEEIDEDELRNVEAAFGLAHREWKRRKRLCMEVLLSFSERADLKVDRLIDTYGIDTDEACDQLFPEGVRT